MCRGGLHVHMKRQRGRALCIACRETVSRETVSRETVSRETVSRVECSMVACCEVVLGVERLSAMVPVGVGGAVILYSCARDVVMCVLGVASRPRERVAVGSFGPSAEGPAGGRADCGAERPPAGDRGRRSRRTAPRRAGRDGRRARHCDRTPASHDTGYRAFYALRPVQTTVQHLLSTSAT